MADSCMVRVVSSPADWEGAVDLRREVFVQEQGVPEEMEMDSLDAVATHLIALHENKVVATARLYLEEDTWHVGRVAVRASWRRKGIGARLMKFAAETARSLGARELVLHAQLAVVPFYERLGYATEGPLFQEAGILHRKMRTFLDDH